MKQTAFLKRKKRRVYTMFKIFSTCICWIKIQNANLEVSGAVRPLYGSLGVKGFNLLEPELFFFYFSTPCIKNVNNAETKYVRIMKQTAFLKRNKRRVYTKFKIFSNCICWIKIQNANLEVSNAVRPLYGSLGVKGFNLLEPELFFLF